MSLFRYQRCRVSYRRFTLAAGALLVALGIGAGMLAVLIGERL